MTSSKGIERNQAKYMLIGLVIGYGEGATNYFLWFDIKIPPVGNIGITLFYLTVFSYVIVKYRFLNIELTVAKSGIFLVLYAFLLGTPF